MIFDTLCSIAEKYLNHLEPIVRRSRLFIFPGKAHEVLEKERFTQERVDSINEIFFLPYQYIAIEDTASCTLLWDKEADVVGTKHERFFVDCQPFGPEAVDNLQSPPNEDESLSEIYRQSLNEFVNRTGVKDAHILSIGRFTTWWEADSKAESGAKRIIDGNATYCSLVSKEHGVLENMGAAHLAEMAPECLRFAATAYAEVLYFNSPDRFVLEKTPVKEKKQNQQKHIPRSHQRPVYTLLTPTEIRERLSIIEPTGKHPTPHERRRHIRRLSSEVFTKKKGQVIIIPATWVGPSEKTVGRHHYKVVLDR